MNAASSVLGSVLAIVIAIQFGLNITLACGAAAYLLALVPGRRTLRPALQSGMNRPCGLLLCWKSRRIWGQYPWSLESVYVE